MEARQQIYRATEQGVRAVATPPAGLSYPCRRILALLQGDTHFEVIWAGMGTCSAAQVAGWLNELERLGLVTAHAVGAECDLDFTGSLSLADLASRHNAR